jgi:hypothetical protein
MSENTPYSAYPEKQARKSPHFVAIFFVILFVVIVILVGLYFVGVNKKGIGKPTALPTPTAKPQPTQGPSITQTPTPTIVELKRGDLTIAVLNGSGVSGAARGISSHLEDLGYTIRRVGNATKFDYVAITIFITDEKKEYLDLLKKDLAGRADSIETEIDNDLSVDAEVIVGK